METTTFKFYRNEKHITTKTFHAKSIEDAFQKADDFLRQTKRYDDWEYLDPKINANNIGTQKSPFGIGS